MRYTTLILLGIPVLLCAQDPSAGAPKLGIWWNETTRQLESLEGVPGSLQLAGETARDGARYWTSSRFLISLADGKLEAREIDSAAIESRVVDGDIEIAFSSDGRRWREYPAGSSKPFLMNDGTLITREGEVLAERDARLLSFTGNALTELVRDGESWKETDRVESPYFAEMLSVHVAGDSLLLLNRSGQLLRWRAGEAEELATAVQGIEALRQEGFFRLRTKTGSRLLYPDSPGQRIYELPTAVAAEVRQ